MLSKCSRICSPLFTRRLATVSPGVSRYPPRKQLTWDQCQKYIRRSNFVLLQLDNLNTDSKANLKIGLHRMGFSLKTPKAHILKKVFHQSGIFSLEKGIVGLVGIAISSRPLHELKDAILFINNQTNITLLGGKFGSHTFSSEGVNELVNTIQSPSDLQLCSISQLCRPANVLVSSIIGVSMHLVNALQQRLDINKSND